MLLRYTSLLGSTAVQPAGLLNSLPVEFELNRFVQIIKEHVARIYHVHVHGFPSHRGLRFLLFFSRS